MAAMVPGGFVAVQRPHNVGITDDGRVSRREKGKVCSNHDISTRCKTQAEW